MGHGRLRLIPLLSLPAIVACGTDRVAFDRLAGSTRRVERALEAKVERGARAEGAEKALDAMRAQGHVDPDAVVKSAVKLVHLDVGRDGQPRALTCRVDLFCQRPGVRAIVRAQVAGIVSVAGDSIEVELEPPTSVSRIETGAPAFRDATAEAGLTDVHRIPALDLRNHLVLGIWPGSGAGAADVDGDGDMDLLALDGVRSILYRNDGHARFEDATAAAGLDGLVGTGCAFADFDGDGDPDLLVTNAFGGNRLFENAGARFQDRTAASGVRDSPKGNSVAVADYDGDGLLDAYVCNSGDYYSYLPDPVWNARNGYPNKLFRNEGGLTFRDRAKEAGVASTGWSLAAAFSDVDGDGHPDLYVANDFGLNQLFRNEGNGTFADVTAASGTGDRGYGMSVTWGDYDGDGLEDLYVSNIESHYAFLLDDRNFPLPLVGRLFRFRVIPMMRTMLSGNSLLRNRGDGTFEDLSRKLRVDEGGWSWGALYLDYDSDGDCDIFAPNGFVSGGEREDAELDFWVDSAARWNDYVKGKAVFDMKGRSLHGYQRDCLFRGSGGGAFDEVGYLEGADLEGDARGAVRADFDGDGRVDLYVRQVKQPGVLLMNQARDAGRIALRLRPPSGRGDALGAVARVHVAGRTLVRVVRAHEGYFSSQDPTILVGLGKGGPGSLRQADRIDVAWPDSRRQSFGPVADGTLLDWSEGQEPRVLPLAP